jgi:hypothetical protein
VANGAKHCGMNGRDIRCQNTDFRIEIESSVF